MSKKNTKIILKGDICPQCGKKLPPEASFCKNCGYKSKKITDESDQGTSEWKKVKIKIIKNNQESKSQKIKKIERVCPSCNALIFSQKLQQCPICMAEIPLEPSLLLDKKDNRLVFKGNKIISEKSLKRDRNSWSIRESTTVFLNSVVMFVIFESIFLIYFTFFPDSSSETSLIPINNFTIIISPIISMILGIFPLVYIKLNKQNYIKLGFTKKKILFFIFIGIISGIFLFFADIFSEFLFLPLIEEFSPKPVHIAQEQELLLNMELILKIFFSFVVVIDQILEEILFRGVIQNSFSKYFNEKYTSKNTIIPKFQSVLTTIGIELAFYLIFTVNPYFLFINLIPSVVISTYFELTKKNMTGLIFLKVTFTIIGLISFFLL